MNERLPFKEKPLPIREVCNIRSGGTESPDELYSFIADSFGSGLEGRYRILNMPALTGDQYRYKLVNISDLVSQFMSQLNFVPPLGATGSFERELFKKLLTGKLAVEAAEVKRARLTGDRIGMLADMLLMEEQAQAAFPNEDEHNRLVTELPDTTDVEALSQRKAELAAVVEEWVSALEQYDLALRELQLEPGETVTERFASFRKRIPEPLDRASARASEKA
jgi:hypothetical protein